MGVKEFLISSTYNNKFHSKKHFQHVIKHSSPAVKSRLFIRSPVTTITLFFCSGQCQDLGLYCCLLPVFEYKKTLSVCCFIAHIKESRVLTSISKNPTIMLYGMAHAVVIYVYGQVHMRSDRGLPTNITTVLFENFHWYGNPSAFFMFFFHFMPPFVE